MMNRRILSACVATLMVSSLSVQAKTDTLFFQGLVTYPTCDLTLVQGGVEADMVDLGTMSATDNRGGKVSFTLKPKSEVNCKSLKNNDAEMDLIVVSNSVENLGDGQDIQVNLVHGSKPVTKNTRAISLGNVTAADFAPEFTAQMVRSDSNVNVTTGGIKTSIAYVVTYK